MNMNYEYIEIETGFRVKITNINSSPDVRKCYFEYIDTQAPAGIFSEPFDRFEKYYTEIDDRKECFTCKQLIDPINQVEYKSAYYHDSCLMNGKPVDLAGISSELLKPGKITLRDNSQDELIKLRAEVEYYRTELAKSHELLGRVTHQLSERWDTVRLTKFYPTDNLHNKRTINNPSGSKE